MQRFVHNTSTNYKAPEYFLFMLFRTFCNLNLFLKPTVLFNVRLASHSYSGNESISISRPLLILWYSGYYTSFVFYSAGGMCWCPLQLDLTQGPPNNTCKQITKSMLKHRNINNGLLILVVQSHSWSNTLPTRLQLQKQSAADLAYFKNNLQLISHTSKTICSCSRILQKQSAADLTSFDNNPQIILQTTTVTTATYYVKLHKQCSGNAWKSSNLHIILGGL